MKRFQAAIVVAVVAAVLVGAVVLTWVYVGQPSFPSTPNTSTPSAAYTYTVIHSYPHDTHAFTEGLAYANGNLYESTGLYGDSSLRRVDLQTGAVEQEANLPAQFFGEGIAIVNDTIVQLTWQEHTGFVYDQSDLSLLSNFSYPTEGWGLTCNGTHLIMSDGSATLRFLNPETFQTVGKIQVHDGNTPVDNLNELEYINDSVYANVWHQQRIAVINPQTGQVQAWIDLTGLQGSVALNSEEVLNGIAYDAVNHRIFVTGKDWPQLFEINLIPSN